MVFQLLFMVMTLGGPNLSAQVGDDITKAGKSGKTVFLVVTEKGIAGEKEARAIASKAQSTAPGTAVITLNRSDKSNASLVSKYGLAGAALPMIMLIAANGVVTGGLPLGDATPEKLRALIPTPKQAAAMLEMNNKKTVFLVFSRKSMTDRVRVLEVARQACVQMGNKAATIEVNLDDKAEQPFISQLEANKKETRTSVFVFNTKGELAGTVASPSRPAELVSLSSKVSKPCCPPGSNKKCGSK